MDLYQVKYGYAEGNELLLGKNKYRGFYNVYNDGSVYSGQFRDVESKKLIVADNYSGDLAVSNYFKDRTVLDEYKLPYNEADVYFDTNELVNCATINTKLKYIQDNLIYIYSRLFFGDTDVPYQYAKVAGVAKNTTLFDWHTARNSTNSNTFVFESQTFASTPNLSSYSEFDNLKKFIIFPQTKTNNTSILGISNTHLIGLTSNETFTDIGIVLYENVIDNNSEEKCQNLSDLTFDGKYLYVTDSQINSGGQVFKYDILSYFTGDMAYEYKRFLIKPIGGLGTSKNKNKFNKCDIIGSKPDLIFVNDSGNKAVKVYNSNFVYKRTLKYSIKFEVKDIRWRPINDSMYVLFYNTETKRYILREYKIDYKFEDFEFEDSLYKETDFEFRRMCFSEVDSNVFYLITKTNIYKKFFSNPGKTFATFTRSKYGQDPSIAWKFQTIKWKNMGLRWGYGLENKKLDLSDVDILNLNDGKDSLFVLANSQILFFKEKTLYNSVLKNIELPYFRTEKVLLNIEENVQSLVFNKELYKIYSNIIQIKNNLKGKFYFKYDNYGDLNYNNYISLLDEEINKLTILVNYDTKINDNEIVVPGVMNRIFSKIIELENLLFELTEPYIPNFRNLPTIDNVVTIE
jgi:hypothetical protein